MLGFWSWVLVIIGVAVIFYAGKLPELQKVAENKLKQGIDAVQKGKKELEQKMQKAKKDEKKADKKAESEDNE